MIDEKKIEEAAEEHCSGTLVVDVLRRASFKAGINWFLDNILHETSEVPNKSKQLMVEASTDKGYCYHVILPFNWEHTIENYNVSRWLYIDDLMKGGK